MTISLFFSFLLSQWHNLLTVSIYFAENSGFSTLRISFEINDDEMKIYTGNIDNLKLQSYLDLTNCPIIFRPDIQYKISLVLVLR